MGREARPAQAHLRKQQKTQTGRAGERAPRGVENRLPLPSSHPLSLYLMGVAARAPPPGPPRQARPKGKAGEKKSKENTPAPMMRERERETCGCGQLGGAVQAAPPGKRPLTRHL